MALKKVVDSLDGLAADVASQYKAKDGKFVLDIEGDEDVSGLKSSLAKARQEKDDERKARLDAEKLSAQYSGLGLTPEQLAALAKNKLTSDEMKKIADGQIDEVFDKRTERLTADFTGRLTAAEKKAQEAEAKASKYLDRVLDDAIRKAAANAGVHAGGVDDALLRAKLVFEVDDEGNAVATKGGTKVISKDGKTVLHPAEWMEDMRSKAPHWFPAPSSGSGTPQGSGIKPGTKTILRSEFVKLNPQEAAATLKSGVVPVDP